MQQAWPKGALTKSIPQDPVPDRQVGRRVQMTDRSPLSTSVEAFTQPTIVDAYQSLDLPQKAPPVRIGAETQTGDWRDGSFLGFPLQGNG